MGIQTSTSMRNVFQLAAEAASRSQHLISPSHLLLGMLCVSDSGAGKLLHGLPRLTAMKTELETQIRKIPPSYGLPSNKKIPLSKESKMAMEQSIVRVMNRDMCWHTIDVLVGIVLEGKSQAAVILAQRSLNRETINEVLAASDRFLDDCCGLRS